MSEHTISEWEKIKGIKILDPDGFDRKDPELFSRLFTAQEFESGMMGSTIQQAPLMITPPLTDGDRELKARTFKLYRPNKAADGISYLEPEISPLEGCLFSDGSLAVRWMTLNHSTAVWPSLNDFMAVHGHADYESYIVWDDTGEKYIVEEQEKYLTPSTLKEDKEQQNG